MIRRKVLHLIDSSGLYGPESVILTLSSSMLATEFLPILGCFVAADRKEPEIVAKAKESGIEVLPIIEFRQFDWLNLKNIIRRNNIDIIHSHGYKGTVLGYIAEGFRGDRMIVTCHLWSKETFRLKIYALIEAVVMRKVGQLIAVSQSVKADIRKMGVRRHDVFVIENGLELEPWEESQGFQKTEYKANLGLRGDYTIIGVFGRLNLQKGHRYLVEVIRNLKGDENNLHVLVVGDGPLRGELSDLCRHYKVGDKFHFLGFREDVKELLAITDIFVMPSVDEGLPIALLEAMAMKKAIVATSVGAIPSVLENDISGILVDKGDVDGLEAAIQILLEKPELRLKLGENAYRTVKERFSSEKMVQQYLLRYRCLVANHTAM